MSVSMLLRLLLVALALLDAVWFGSRREWIALAVFALPPLLLVAAVARDRARGGFWAGVLALGWFSHGVMVAWTRPPERVFALAEVLLSVALVLVASLPGLRRRFARRTPDADRGA